MSTNRVRPTPHAIDLGAVTISVSDYASQGNAILGIRDSGKSYTATAIAEKLLAAEIPIVAFDPIGVWRNLRHAGTGPGFEFILVGETGDIPADPDTAEALTRHAMKRGASIVFDLYGMETASKSTWRTIVQKCVEVLLYENKAHGLRHVFMEEAAEFAPQLIRPEQASVYGTIEKLARMGGNAMLGYTLINQRGEQVNKAVLELCDCLFLHRQKGRNSLTSLGKWLDFGDRKASAEIISKLPTLPQGECFIWANGSERPVLTKIPAKRTFHPNRREGGEGGMIRPGAYLLEGFKVTRPAKAATAPKAAHAPETPHAPEPERVEVPVFREGELAKLEQLQRLIEGHIRDLQTLVSDAAIITKALDSAVKRGDSVSRERTLPTAVRTAPSHYSGNKTVESKGPQRMLAILAGRHPLRVTKAQLGTMCGFTPGTVRAYLPGIRSAGFIDETRDGIGITPEGIAQAGESTEKIPTGGEPLLTFWCSKLGQGEANVLKALYDCRGKVIDAAQLQAMTGYTPGTVRAYLPMLRRNNLIDPKELRIMPEFLTNPGKLKYPMPSRDPEYLSH